MPYRLYATTSYEYDVLGNLARITDELKNQTTINQVPVPRESVQQLLTAAHVEIPRVLPYSGTKVYTKKKLPEERQRH